MNCEFCQSPVHIWFDCPKKPKGWKPARLAKSNQARPGEPLRHIEAGAVAEPDAQSTAARKADVQRPGTAERSQVTVPVVVSSRVSDLPVDTSRVRKKALAGEVPSVNEHPETEGKLVQVQQSHSANKFDKKAWMREYMRGYMRKLREEQREYRARKK